MTAHIPAETTVRSTPPHDDDLHDFLEDYARALAAGDGHGVAALWEAPALVVGDGGVIAIDNLNEIAVFFGRAREQYAARGITDTRADVMHRRWVNDRIVEVETRWPLFDKHGDEQGAERATYTLRRDERGQLRLRAVIQHGIETPDDTNAPFVP